MKSPAEVTTYLTSIGSAETELQSALASLRLAAKAVNDLGALASKLQRDAQDMEYTATPEMKALLDGSYIQRTGFVNKRAAEASELLRQLSRGVIDLMADGAKATELVTLS